MGGVRWGELFALDTPLLEIMVRGVVVYLALLVLLRLARHREAGGVGVTDLLVLVLLADAAQNAMAGGYRSITDGVILVATILLCAFVLDWLGYRVRVVAPLVRARPVRLIENGQVLQWNLRRELITADELMAQLRLHGLDNVADVKEAWIEGDGRISVVQRSGLPAPPAGQLPPQRGLPPAA